MFNHRELVICWPCSIMSMDGGKQQIIIKVVREGAVMKFQTEFKFIQCTDVGGFH